MDTDCAICCILQRIEQEFATISNYIDTFGASSTEFGLNKGFINRQIKTVQQMQKWHMYFHVTGESLSGGGGTDTYSSPPSQKPNPRIKYKP